MVNKYQYNGIELTNDFGLMINEARYRTLDPQLGRWWQIDPEVEQFEAWSAYNSNLDNPIRYEDKDGDCPTCFVGAIVGAAVDYGFQVGTNIVEGKSVKQSLTDVDGWSIAASAVAGAASSGLSAFVPKGIVGKGAKIAAEQSINVAESVFKQTKSDDGSVTLRKTLSDVTATGVTKVVASGAKNVINTKTAAKTLDRATRVAKGDPTSSGRAAAVKKATTQVARKNIANEVINETRSEVFENSQQTMYDKALKHAERNEQANKPKK